MANDRDTCRPGPSNTKNRPADGGAILRIFEDVSNTARRLWNVTVCVPPHIHDYNRGELSVALGKYSSKP